MINSFLQTPVAKAILPGATFGVATGFFAAFVRISAVACLISYRFSIFVVAQELQPKWHHSFDDRVWRICISPDGTRLLENAFKSKANVGDEGTEHIIRIVDTSSGKLLLSKKSERTVSWDSGNETRTGKAWMFGLFADDNESFWVLDQTGVVERISVDTGVSLASYRLPDKLELDSESAEMFGEDCLVFLDRREKSLWRLHVGDLQAVRQIDYTTWDRRIENKDQPLFLKLGGNDDLLCVCVDSYVYQLAKSGMRPPMLTCELPNGIPSSAQFLREPDEVALFWPRQFTVMNFLKDKCELTTIQLPIALKQAVMTHDRKLAVGYRKTSPHFETDMKLIDLQTGHIKSYKWGDEPGVQIIIDQASETVVAANLGGLVTAWQIVRVPEHSK